MRPNERDESTVVDLASLNSQGQQIPRQQQPRQQRTQGPTAPTDPSLSNPDLVFDHLASLDSSSLDPPPAAAGSGASNNNNNKNARNSRGQNHQSRAPKNDEHKDCPRHTEGHPPNRLTTRELGGKRVVSLFYGSDVVLFDTIMTYRLGNPDKRVEDAIDAFSEHQGADALANIVYETQAFDMIFKYPIPEHLRKVSDVPPAVGLGPSLSDIEIDSTSSDAVARKEERLEKQRQLLNQQEKERLAALEREKDVEAAPMDSKIAKAEELERLQIRFKKAMLRESLVIEEEPNIDGDEMYMKVYAPFWRLCIEAQRLRYKVELTHIPTEKEKAASDAAVSNAEGRGAWARRFWQLIQRFDHVSLPLRAESLLFKASKLRQYALAEKSRKWSDIVRHGGGIQPDGSGVGSNMGTDGKDGFFGTARRGNLTESIVIRSKIRTKRGDRYALRTVVDKKAITDMFTLHDGSYKSKVKPIPNRRTLLFNEWIRIRRPQPLEEIRFYYGEKIALYFAWIDFYTKWLVSAAIVGFVFLIFGLINYFYLKGDAFLPNNEVGAQLVDIFDNALTLPFTLFMAVWSSLFVEYWKRKSNVLAYQWNTLDFERHERARPEFKPTGTRISPVTGKMELYYPRYKQLISIIISILVVLISIAIVIVSVGSLILLNVWLKNGHGHLNSYVVTVITAILNLVVIMILGTVYSRIAKILTDNENHRRLTQYEDALIVKRFLFDFVNFYSALVYIAYFKDNIGSTLINKEEFHDRCPNDSCMGELTIQLAIVFVGKQFLNQFQELAVPQAKKWWNLKNELAEKTVLKGKYKDKKNMVKPPQWAKDDTLPNYDPSMFEEYRELVIQFGFCTLFVTAFPIAPIFALLNNVLERRVDAYKLLTQHRRPIAQHTQDIGSWSIILMLLTHVSVLTNALLIAFRSKWMENNVFMKLPWVAQSGDNMYALLAVRLLFIFIFEHLVFIFKVGIANLVRDQPRTVKLAIERENYYARLALDDEEPAMDEVLEDHDTDTDESEDEDIYDLHKKLLDDNYTNYEEKDGIPGGGSTSPSGDGNDRLGDPAADDEEDEEELEALIKAGGCGCAAHGDGNVGTAKSGFEGTWMSRFKPDAQAALRRRQQRRKRKQNAKKAVDEI